MKSVDSEIDVSHVQIRVFYGIAVGISDQGAADHESGGRTFEWFRARQLNQTLTENHRLRRRN